MLAVLGPLTTFSDGLLRGFVAVTAELYPTAIRATAQFTYNVGRMGSALAPFIIGSLAQTQGFGTAFALLAVALPRWAPPPGFGCRNRSAGTSPRTQARGPAPDAL